MTFLAMQIALVVLGLTALIYGASKFVNGAIHLATALGVSMMLIGLTVVSLGTSGPELVVSVMAGLQDQGHLAIGNVLGSNLSNLGLILGISLCLAPIPISMAFRRLELPALGVSTALLIPFLGDGLVSRVEGAVFIGLMGVLFWAWRRREKAHGEGIPLAEMEELQEEMEQEETSGGTISLKKSTLEVLIGLVLLLIGGRLTVDAAVEIATFLNISERIIGLTMVAVGTSLPELATSVVAVRKKQSDIILGNVVGSNLANILLVLGIASLLKPLDFADASAKTDIFAVCVLTAVTAFFCLIKSRMARWNGPVLFLLYLFYMLWAVQSDFIADL
jgi:cation:H+ antiporter